MIYLPLVCVSVLVTGKVAAAAPPFDGPCPEVFQYVLDNSGILYGRIQLPHPVSSPIQLEVELSIGNKVQGYNGNIELGYTRNEAVDDLINRRPLRYKLYFPIWRGVPPKVTKISVNGDLICVGPPIDITTVQILTTVKLQHTLNVNVTPPLKPSDPHVGFDTSFNSEHQENNRRTNLPPGKGGVYRPSVEFNPQPPKDPGKIYQSNPFLTDEGFASFAKDVPSNTIPSTSDAPSATSVIPDVRIQPKGESEAAPSAVAAAGSRGYLSSVCGKSSFANSLVANGSPSRRGEFPWLTAIYTKKDLGLEFTCGGSLISTKHVVTAAHCMKKNDRTLKVGQILVILGKYNIQQWTNEDVLANAQEIVLHPDYRPMSADADLAIVVLERHVKFTKFVKPVCWWSEGTDLKDIVGARGTVVGWGKDENGAIITAEPKQISLPVVGQDDCIRSHDTFQDITSERTFCAGYRNGSGPCNGDSGGGFLLRRGNRWTLRGIVSMSISDHVKNCDLSQFVVFTDVAKFTDWLSSHLR